MKHVLFEFGKENANGRTYLKEQMSDLPGLVPCTFGHQVDFYENSILNPSINGEQTCAMAKIYMDNEGLYAEVKPYEDKKEMFDELMMNGCRITSCGTGSLNEKNEVEDFRLHYVFLTKDPS
jgi:hypothetical protein